MLPPIPGAAKLVGAFWAGARDIHDGLAAWRIWYLIGSAEMRRRYARSKLGPIWVMVSSAILIGTLGFMWSVLWRLPVAEMLPYVGIGLITWQLISGVLTDATTAFPINSHYFLNQYLAASSIVFSLIYRNGVIFLMNMLFPMLIVLWMGEPLTAYSLLAIPGFVLLAITCFWSAFVTAIVCARFRDVTQIVTSIMQVAMYVTPVVWKPEQLPGAVKLLVYLNPFSVGITVFRDPLLGRPVPWEMWALAFTLAFVGLLLALPFIGRFRRRLIYWL
jgi:ABC-type polysaccharide/polyol phosphate export permease